MTRTVHVRAPCRLHFGMFSFGHTDRPQFGGVGMMIDPPAVEVTLKRAAQFKATGSLTGRTKQFVELAASGWRLPCLPACEICVRSPHNHIGLGVGTQLGLSVAAGLRRFLNLPELPVESLAGDVGRAARSAVGTHGFRHGGLIVDAGHTASESIGRLAHRLEVPEDWRIVLVILADQRGLAGTCEADAFARLPPVPESVSRQLWQITEEEMVPALHRSDCETFGDVIYRFGRLAGGCFSSVQGGPFASHKIAQLIDSIRNSGVAGVGQSSWGPTVFSLCSSESEARSLCEQLQERKRAHDLDLAIAKPGNSGARITVHAS